MPKGSKAASPLKAKRQVKHITETFDGEGLIAGIVVKLDLGAAPKDLIVDESSTGGNKSLTGEKKSTRKVSAKRAVSVKKPSSEVILDEPPKKRVSASEREILYERAHPPRPD